MRGAEIEVGVLGNLPTPVASVPGQVVSHFADWYDWSSKYDDGGSDLVIPPPGVTAAAGRARARSGADGLRRHRRARGWRARTSSCARPTARSILNELNTIPGFTSTSFYTRLFEASGIPYGELIDRLIALALERHERRQGLVY